MSMRVSWAASKSDALGETHRANEKARRIQASPANIRGNSRVGKKASHPPTQFSIPCAVRAVRRPNMGIRFGNRFSQSCPQRSRTMTTLLPRGTESRSAVRRPSSIECVETDAGIIWIEETIREYRWKAVRQNQQSASVECGTAPCRKFALHDAGVFLTAHYGRVEMEMFLAELDRS